MHERPKPIGPGLIGQRAANLHGLAIRAPIPPYILSLLAGIVGLTASGIASQVPVDALHASLRPPRLHWRLESRSPGIGTAQSGRQSLLDPRLAGEWHWEAESLYIPGAEILIKASSILTIYRDGGFILQEEGNVLGGVSYRGRMVQQGDTLTGCCEDGQTFTTKFALDESDGLWVAGRLYGRQ
jgi:hypothetical protein